MKRGDLVLTVRLEDDGSLDVKLAPETQKWVLKLAKKARKIGDGHVEFRLNHVYGV